MTKRIIAIAMAAMLVILGSISAFAATEPKVTSDAICYISFQTGNNDYDGQSVDTPKKQFLSLEDTGCISVLADGGTLIAVGKAYIGGDYIMPELGSTLKITSNDGKANYKNGMPFENPACAMKMRSGVTLTLQQDTIIDDIILFQESAMNTIIVANNSTLVIGDKVECMSNIAAANPCYMAIEVEKGSTVILNGGTFEQVTGDGTIVNNGATIVGEKTDAPVTSETTKATEAPVTSEPAKTTTPAKTSEPAATSGKEPTDTTASAASTDAVVTEDTASATAATEKTTAKESASTTEKKETAPASSAVSTAATEPAPASEGGLGTGAIIGIVAAVVVVIAVVALIIVKKKK